MHDTVSEILLDLDDPRIAEHCTSTPGKHVALIRVRKGGKFVLAKIHAYTYGDLGKVDLYLTTQFSAYDDIVQVHIDTSQGWEE